MKEETKQAFRALAERKRQALKSYRTALEAKKVASIKKEILSTHG